MPHIVEFIVVFYYLSFLIMVCTVCHERKDALGEVKRIFLNEEKNATIKHKIAKNVEAKKLLLRCC